MKKILLFTIIITVSSNYAFCQSLSEERVKKIKESTVRITIENSDKMGTGFYFNDMGEVATCWHVIQPSINLDSAGKIIGFKKIYIENNNGEKIEYGIPIGFFQNSTLNQNAVAYDFCILIPVQKRSLFIKNSFLKLGNFENLNEGDEVYTCGYPIGIIQKFISRGIVSTKYIDPKREVFFNGNKILKPRSEVLLDITLNRGNSGGAIIKIGKSIDEDEVVAIADFIVTPIGGIADNLIKTLNNSSGGFSIQGIDPNATFSLLTQIISSLSIGVSGAVSINHLLISLGLPLK